MILVRDLRFTLQLSEAKCLAETLINTIKVVLVQQ